VTKLERALVRIAADLRQLGVRFALVGGLAVSVRAEPRTTRDIDLAIAVDGDRQAEAVVRELLALGWRVGGQLEQDRAGRLASTRLFPSDAPRSGIVVDLLFASSGIEQEVVAGAEDLEVLENVSLPVASAAHLVALKLLADRLQDRADVQSLLSRVDVVGLDVVRESLERIAQRGFDRGSDLPALFGRALRVHAANDEER
jgi:hypothetical protein